MPSVSSANPAAETQARRMPVATGIRSPNYPHMLQRSPANQLSHVPVAFGSAAFVFLNFGLPIYTKTLGASATAIGGLYAAFTITLLVIRPLVGLALDRYSRRKFYVAAFGFYAFAMLSFSQAELLWHFYVARSLQGLGAALMWVAAKTIIADVTEADRRGEAMGRLSAVSVRGSMLGAFYGFTLVGFMPMQQAWQLAFFGYAVMAAIGLLVAARVTPETRFPIAAKQPLSQQPIVWSRQTLQLLALVSLTTFASALIEPIYLIYLQDKFSAPVYVLALAFFPAGVLYAVLPIYGGRLADRAGQGYALAAGLCFAGVTAGLLPWLPSLLVVAVCYCLLAVGWCMAKPAEEALYARQTDPASRGRMMGYKEMVGGFGSALGPLVGGMIYDHHSATLVFTSTGVLLIACAAFAYHWFGPGGTRGPRRQAAGQLLNPRARAARPTAQCVPLA